MNITAVRLLFLKDLFLSRRPLFGYFAAGLACSLLAFAPEGIVRTTGSILTITIAIAAGLHLIGGLLLGEAIENTRLFILSLPVSLLDYSIAKVAVVLTTYLIPWSAMLACSMIFAFIAPGARHGAAAIVPVVFFYLLASFTLQLAAAVVTESFGWTICVVVGCNVLLNVFLGKLFEIPEIAQAAKSDVLAWPPVVLQLLAVEVAVIVASIAVAVFFQTRKRDLV
jgi:ABC-2 type transport system permease protein